MTWNILPVWPLGVITVVALALLIAVAWSSLILHRRNVAPAWVRRLAYLRLLAVAIVILMLLRPVVSLEREAVVRSDRILLLDTSASMGLRDAADGQTRLRNALDVLREPVLRRALLDGSENHWFAFDSDARPVEATAANALRADGTDSRIGSAIEQAWNLYRWSLDQTQAVKPPPRVLLVSDGLDRGRLDSLETALSLGVAVDVLSHKVAPLEPEPRLEISNVQYSRRLLLGSELRMHVTVRQTGLEGVPVRLVLSTEDQRLQSHSLRFAEHQAERFLTLNHRPIAAGVRRYRLHLETDVAEAEAVVGTAEPVELTVRVESHQHEVLVIEPEWRWDFRFLRRVLESDPNFAFSGFLSRGPGVYIQFGEPQRRVSLGGFPRSRAEIEGFDTFILGDLHPARLPPQLPDALYELVVEQGKSLVVIAGPNIGAWRRQPRLSALLPVELYPDSSGSVEGPVPVRVSQEGQASPFFFAPVGAPSVRQWPRLPPMDQMYAPLRKKPAATILLESQAHRNAFGPLIVAAVHTVGRGQVLFIGTDTLWKWQMQGSSDADGNTPYQVFWQQAMRAIRPDRLSAAPVHLWVQPERTQSQAGQTVAVHARIEADRSLQDLKVVGRMRLPDGRMLPMLFTRHPESTDRFQAAFVATEAGLYEIQAEALTGGQTAAEAVANVDVTRMPPETDSIPPNESYLERLATGSGGVIIDPERPETWRTALGDTSDRTEMRTVSLNIWSNLWLILALTLVLGVDWVIRLMRGYV